MVFNAKKLLNEGVNLMPQGRAKRSVANGMRTGLADFR
jgi:hypothetical protein